MSDQSGARSLYRAEVDGDEILPASDKPEIFTEVRKLGEGSTCVTYLALSPEGYRVVIKELFPRELRRLYRRQSDGSPVLGEGLTLLDRKRIGRARAAFVREYNWQRELQRRNSFTGGNDPMLYLSGDSVYNVMRYDGEQVTQEKMADYVSECLRQAPPVDYIRVILGELRNYAEELANAHDMGCLVSDVKPGNLLITRSGTALSYRRMIDYGSVNRLSDIRALADGASEGVSSFSYTQEFAAPEVIRRAYDRIGPWSDVYSFGMTAVTLLLGGVIENTWNLLSQSAMDFRRVILSLDRYKALSVRDACFMMKFRHFCRYTLADEVAADDIQPEEAFLLMQSEKITKCRRVRSMRCVIRMIDALLDGGHASLGEPEVRRRVKRRTGVFSDNFYGMPGESENNRALFSENLLPLLRAGDAAFPFTDLMAKITDDLLINGTANSVYIEGKSGAGKTTALQYLACRAAGREGGPLPVWISLADLFLSGRGDREKALRRCIAESLFGPPDYDEIARTHDAELERYLTGEGCRPPLLLMFDGLNEASLCSSDVSEWLDAIWGLCQRSNVISVFSGHDQLVEFRKWRGMRAHVMPCSRETAEGYLRHLTLHLRDEAGNPRFHWYPELLGREIADRTLGFLDSPMLLHYFAVRYLDIPIDASQLPRNRALLIEQYLTRLGRNCAMERVHRLIAGDSMQTDIPYGYFLMSSVAGGVCLQMLENRSASVSAKEIRMILDSRLSTAAQPDGTLIRMIGNQYISQAAYHRMISFDTEGENSGSWLSHFFVSRASGNFSVIHETIGVYLAARFLADVIKTAGSKLPPNAFLRHDLPGELIGMTAMLLEYGDMKALKSGIRNVYGGALKRFFTKQIKEFTGNDDVLLNNEFRAYDFESTGHIFHQIVNNMDNLSRSQRFRLLWGMPDNKVRRWIDSFLTKEFRKGHLTPREKELLGTAMRRVASQEDVLAAARLLWQKRPDMRFQSDMDVLVKACEDISDYAADLLEKNGVGRGAAELTAMLLLGGETVNPDAGFVKNYCCVVMNEMGFAGLLTAKQAVSIIYPALHAHPLVKVCPRLIHVFGAKLVLDDVLTSFEEGTYSSLLTEVLPDELIYEVSRLAFFRFSEVHESFYPEKWHEAILQLKPALFKAYAVKKKSGERFRSDVEGGFNYTDPAQLLIVQFCAVEYEIMSSSPVNGVYLVNQAQLNALTQLFVMINYVLCDGHIGRMGSSLLQFEADGIYGKAVCAKGVSPGERMGATMAMLTLRMYRSMPERTFYRCMWQYAKDYRFLYLNHLSKKSLVKFAGYGLLLTLFVWVAGMPKMAYLIVTAVILLMPGFFFLVRLYLLVLDLISHTTDYFRLSKKPILVLIVLAHLPALLRLGPRLLGESGNLVELLREIFSSGGSGLFS